MSDKSLASHVGQFSSQIIETATSLSTPALTLSDDLSAVRNSGPIGSGGSAFGGQPAFQTMPGSSLGAVLCLFLASVGVAFHLLLLLLVRHYIYIWLLLVCFYTLLAYVGVFGLYWCV